MPEIVNAVEMRGIVKRFPGVLANDHVDFDLRQGEVHALLGENGAGKSTLMNVLAGMYKAEEGTTFVEWQARQLQFAARRHCRWNGHDPPALHAGAVADGHREHHPRSLDIHAFSCRWPSWTNRSWRFKSSTASRSTQEPKFGSFQRRRTTTRRDPKNALPRGESAHHGRADRGVDPAGDQGIHCHAEGDGGSPATPSSSSAINSMRCWPSPIV